jgi:hypothetical protein
MKSACMILIYCLASYFAIGQYMHAPGGVPGVTHWYVADSLPSSYSLRTYQALTDTVYHQLNPSAKTTDQAAMLNFHPALHFTAASQVKIVLGSGDMSKASYFTVYQPDDTAAEYHIWHLYDDNKVKLVLTTKRMADLVAFKYMNYRDLRPAEPKISTYVQQKTKDSITSLPLTKYWQIGQLPAVPTIPVKPFKGMVPELIAFNRVLTSQERLQVASYLAIKYGITITEPTAQYYNSAGQLIWDGELYSAFHHNVAGIARDDTSGLLQVLSTSGNSPGLLTVAANNSPDNNTSLIWGDNNLPLAPGPRMAGMPALLQRKWLMVAHDSIKRFVTDLMLDTRKVDAPLPPGPVYWLAIDSSGSDGFALTSTTFIPMSLLDQAGMAHFPSLTWNTSKGAGANFTFIVGQALLVAADLTDPSCALQESGQLQLKIFGGQAPYNVSVFKDGHLFISQPVANNNSLDSVTGIGEGRYLIQVEDAAQHVYTDSFYVNDSDAPHPSGIAGSYLLERNAVLTLDASSGMPAGISYIWDCPDRSHLFTSVISISKPGIYTLTCTSAAGCVYRQDISVTPDYGNRLGSLVLYPNPSTGAFAVKIMLYAPTALSVSILEQSGRLVSQQLGEGFANYLFNENIPISGVYIMVARFSDGSQVSRKVIVGK